MERRKHWWNGRFANPARRDVYLWAGNDGRWHVEARRGSLNQRSRLFAFNDEAKSKVFRGCAKVLRKVCAVTSFAG